MELTKSYEDDLSDDCMKTLLNMQCWLDNNPKKAYSKNEDYTKDCKNLEKNRKKLVSLQEKKLSNLPKAKVPKSATPDVESDSDDDLKKQPKVKAKVPKKIQTEDEDWG